LDEKKLPPGYNEHLTHKRRISMSKERYTVRDAVADLAAGVDPTGTNTYRRASASTGNDRIKRAVGDVGGVIGGTAIGALAPAAAMAGVGLALKRKNPVIAQQFINSARGSADIINPFAMRKHLSAAPHLANMMGKADSVTKFVSKPNPIGAYKAVRDAGTLNRMSKDISKKYYHGGDVGLGAGRTMVALTTLPAALASGVLNSSSAHMQYGEALKQRSLAMEKKSSLYEVCFCG